MDRGIALQRFLVRGKQRARAGNGRHYTPDQTVNAEAWVKHCALTQAGSPCVAGPVKMTIEIGVAVPASWPKSKRAAAFAGAIWPTGKPDWDNSGKLIADALNGIAYRDDSQIVQASVVKYYAENPGAVVTIETMDPAPSGRAVAQPTPAGQPVTVS